MPIILRSQRFQKVNMSVPDLYGTGGIAAKLMEMILIKISAELNKVNMISASYGDCLSGHSGKTMVVRFFLRLSYLNASLNLVNMLLIMVGATIMMKAGHAGHLLTTNVIKKWGLGMGTQSIICLNLLY